jgi:hypothetical protein
MNKPIIVIDKELMKIVYEKLGLKNGDSFILKHSINENQNEYNGIIFSLNDDTVYPENKMDLFKVCAGFYDIEFLGKTA